jgi:lipopolysaccharide/colanic/teichoic acid biosynthesis glycosyltransferase
LNKQEDFRLATSVIELAEQIRERERRRTSVSDMACRVLDLVVASLMLLLLLPLMAIIAIAIRLDSPGPVLFRQRRCGRALADFTVHKFRTMRNGASQDVHRAFVVSLIDGHRPEQPEGGPRFKLSSDTRVTRIGRFLRRSSLDELPQLWNVLRGEMSLVGPRPALSYEVEHYPPYWFDRFAVKPGITGLWQVSGRSELTMEDMVRLDIEYVRRRSFWFNLRILVRTLPVVLSARGA